MKQSQETKLIFLDLDGVVNSELFFTTTGRNLDKSYMINHIDDRAIEILNYIYDETKCKIVISSSWRDTCFHDELLHKKGYKGDVIGVTPSLHNYCRGAEIKKWLENNVEDYKTYSKYIILDDDTDMLYGQRYNFFKTDGYCGLTYNIGLEVIEFLNHGIRH